MTVSVCFLSGCRFSLSATHYAVRKERTCCSLNLIGSS